MNLNGIGNLPGMLRPTHPDPRTRVENGQSGHAVPALGQTAVRPTREATPAAELAQTLPVEPPPGTDPALWSVLTGEERAFFAKVGTLGPLTYGRVMQAQNAPPSIRGGRLDIKV